MKKIVLLIIFSVAVQYTWTQENTIEPTVFDKTDGLKLTTVRSVAFDNDNFIWLAGEDINLREILGSEENAYLQRFNGQGFDNIAIPKDFGKVRKVTQLFKRSDGKFYLQAFANENYSLILFDPITTHFKSLNIPKSKESNLSISPVYHYKNKNYVLIQGGQKVTLYHLKDDLQFVSVFSFLYTDRKFSLESAKLVLSEKYCIVSDDNIPIHAFNWSGELIRKYSPEDLGIKKLNTYTQMLIDECYFVNDICYFFLRWNPQLFRLNLNDLSIQPVAGAQFPSDNLHVINRGGKSFLVTRAKDSLNFYDIQKETFTSIYFNPKFGKVPVQRSFSRNLSKELWLVTNKHQLLHYSIEKKPINSTLEKYAIRALYSMDAENILVGTESNGWFTFNTKTKTSEAFKLQYENSDCRPNCSIKMIPIGNRLWSSDFSSVMSMNLQNKEVFKSKKYPISCMAQRSETQLVYGTNQYELAQYDIPSDKHETLLKTDTLAIIDIRINKDWVIAGTDKGLLLYQFSTKKSRFIRKNKTLLDPYILSISKVSEGLFVLGTKYGHLYTFDARSQKIKLVYKDELKAGIANVLVDEDNRWWLATFNGMVCFNPVTKNLQRYSTLNGLSHNEANRYSSLKIGNTFYFGSLAGLNYFSPHILHPEIDSAQLCLLMSEVFDENTNSFFTSLNRKVLNTQNRFNVPSTQRSFKLKFGVKRGEIGAEYAIKYRLNNGRWSAVDQSNIVYFSNLAPGKYKMEVQLLDFSGKKLGQNLLYTIVVKPFFYESIWFLLILLIVGTVIVGWYFFQQRKQAKMRERFAEELIHLQESERSRISKELHDSVGQQLTLLKKTAQNREQHDLSTLANNTLEEVRTISKNLHPPLLKELGLTESIRALVDVFDEETDVFFTVDLEDVDHFFNENEALHIYRFVQEALSNLMKHARTKTAYVAVQLVDKKQVKVIIQDAGIGMKNDSRNFSLGLTTMQERVRILNGNFNIEKLNQGTRLVAKIPVK